MNWPQFKGNTNPFHIVNMKRGYIKKWFFKTPCVWIVIWGHRVKLGGQAIYINTVQKWLKWYCSVVIHTRINYFLKHIPIHPFFFQYWDVFCRTLTSQRYLTLVLLVETNVSELRVSELPYFSSCRSFCKRAVIFFICICWHENSVNGLSTLHQLYTGKQLSFPCSWVSSPVLNCLLQVTGNSQHKTRVKVSILAINSEACQWQGSNYDLWEERGFKLEMLALKNRKKQCLVCISNISIWKV